jgi:hypothetical protein
MKIRDIVTNLGFSVSCSTPIPLRQETKKKSSQIPKTKFSERFRDPLVLVKEEPIVQQRSPVKPSANIWDEEDEDDIQRRIMKELERMKEKRQQRRGGGIHESIDREVRFEL